jgi:hypothetical protein
METNIYKQSLLDAKAVRASIIANAKAELQEAIEPKIQDMIRTKLSEELEEELEEEVEEGYDMEEGETHEEGYYGEKEDQTMSEDDVTDATLEEILAELDALEEDQNLIEVEENVEEEGYNMEEGVEEAEEEAEDDETVDAEIEDEEETTDDETKVVDITLGDLKQVLQSVMAQKDTTADEFEASEEESEESSEEPLSLDEILAELEEAEGHKEEKHEEGKKVEEMEKELEEAKNTIAALNETLQDINLLNAKLLYMNKIFKAKTLTESEKVKVIKAFDRSTSVKEVKNTFETLKESLSVKKSQLKESVGFASKAAGVAPSKPIIESNDFVSRWQKIAGIK